MSYVTIIIPYKSNLKYLFLALRSVFKQSYKNYKILIIYDNEDKTDLYKIKNFIKKNNFKTKFKISISINKRNLGAGMSRNIGIKKSKSKYVAFLDSDDLWTKNKLNLQIDFMKKNNLVISHTSYFVINSQNKIISHRNSENKVTFSDLIKSCDIGLSTVIINLNFLKKNNFYFPKLKTKEDYVLWLKIIKKIRVIKGMKMKLSYYRKTKNSLSSNKFLALKNGFRVYRDFMNFGFVKSLYSLFILSINFVKKKIIYDFNNYN